MSDSAEQLGMGRPWRRARGAALLLALVGAACNDTVFEVVPTAEIHVTVLSGPAADVLQPGQTVQLAASVVGADGRVLSGRTVTWATSADAVAGIDQTGRVTARTPGAVTFSAAAEGKSVQRPYTVQSAVPTISSLSPTIALPNTAFNLTVSGSGFYSGSQVRWNGANRTTTFVSGSELRAAIPATDLGVHGPFPVTVVNGAPGGGASNAATVTVRPTDPCQYQPPHTIPSSLTGRIESTDCRLNDGSYADIFGFTIPTAQFLTFRMTSAAGQVDPFLLVTNPTGNRVFAFNDDTGSSLNSTISMIIATGSYRVYASTQPANQVGDYALTSEAGPNLVTGCSEFWIMQGVQTTQSLTAADCRVPSGGGANFLADRYALYLLQGQAITVTMASSDVNAYLLIRQAGSLNVLAEDNNSAGGTNARVTYTATNEGMVIIEASTFTTGESGNYTLIIP